MKFEVCHELYETTQTIICFIALNLCISSNCMYLESFNIKEVKTSLGNPILRDIVGQNKKCFLICVVCKVEYQRFFCFYKIVETYSRNNQYLC